MSGASVAPTIEPVAKITAELAPVSACAAASRTTLERARASAAISSAAVTSIIGLGPDLPDMRRALLIHRTMKVASGPINRRKRACAMQRHSVSAQPFEYQNEIVGGQGGGFNEIQADTFGQRLYVRNISHAPFGVIGAQAGVEHRIA